MGKPDGYRNNHQVHSKYRDINTKVSKFAAIYNNLLNNRRSEMSDADILQDAHELYREQNHGNAFNHKKCWDILKSSPRRDPVPLVESTERPRKRNKTRNPPRGLPQFFSTSTMWITMTLQERKMTFREGFLLYLKV